MVGPCREPETRAPRTFSFTTSVACCVREGSLPTDGLENGSVDAGELDWCDRRRTEDREVEGTFLIGVLLGNAPS